MASIRRLLMAGIATLLVASACTTISAPPSIPPINIPSLPPINLPSIPPINLPSIPPINIPSIPPITLPSGIVIPPITLPTAEVPCALITTAEISAIVGSVSDQSSSTTACSFVGSDLTIYTVSLESGSAIDSLKLVVPNGEDLTVGGNRAYYANFLVDTLTVEKGGNSLTIASPLQQGKKDTLTAIANIALTRF